jgi:hypothetical protein
MNDHFERTLLERLLIGAFLVLALLAGPALALATYPK